VQRTGPSTGMPTRTQQGDLMLTAYASHGDTKHIALYPSDPAECFAMAVQAFDLAERFQTPVFVLSDLDIGMNDWLCPRLRWDDGYRPDRGKVLSAEELESMQPTSGTSMSTATTSRRVRCRACTRAAHTSRAARVTRSSARTRRTPPTTSR
jgi:pyruvate/2-oxoacid:ferredoxin oxidoreductase alpha subunit